MELRTPERHDMPSMGGSPRMEPVDPASPPAPAFIVIGSARLPKTVGGEESGALMIELAVNTQDGRVTDVAATVPLPGYIGTLRSLLVGRRLDEVEDTAQKLSAHLRGPLLKPTIAALANCVSNGKEPTQPFSPMRV